MGYELTKGTKLNNRYVIECTLGSGGFGTTYKAMDTLIDVPVAIKEYENSSEKDRKVAQREVKMAARFYALDGIASARDFFVVDSISYIVMEYVEGESLKKYVRNYGTMKGEDILTKLKPVIESLCVIHKEGIIHRDISPDNLMVTKGGSIQLIDFGEARNFEEQRNKELTLVYKRGYAPIEQCRQRGKQALRKDHDAQLLSGQRLRHLRTHVEREAQLQGDGRIQLGDQVSQGRVGHGLQPALRNADGPQSGGTGRRRQRTHGGRRRPERIRPDGFLRPSELRLQRQIPR